MNVLMCASEVAPYSKTGGLADVAGALPAELLAQGVDVRVVTPLHRGIDRAKYALAPAELEPLAVPVGFGEQWCRVWEGRLPGTEVPVYFLEHQRYWDRSGIYAFEGRDHDDNAERFAFLARAACQLCKLLRFPADVIHGHDWHAGLIPILLKTHYAADLLLGGTASVLTIHNIGHQGEFGAHQLGVTQLGGEWFTEGALEFHGKMNYLKAGILWADKVTAVSPTYAFEVQTPEGGFGLDGACRSRSADLVGILNGLNYREWNPAADPYGLPAAFDVDRLEGKAECKRDLQRAMGLAVRPDVPLAAVVSRLAPQKGIDLIAGAAPHLLGWDVQFALVGSGEGWAEDFFRSLPGRFPGKAGSYIGFSEAIAHRTYAACDFFLMPSRYEPCGLGQMSAMRYGALPVVRSVGGLKDTVESFDNATGLGTGFRFDEASAGALANTLGWAVGVWYDRPADFLAMRRRAMEARFEWKAAAARYLEVYRWAVERRRGHV